MDCDKSRRVLLTFVGLLVTFARYRAHSVLVPVDSHTRLDLELAASGWPLINARCSRYRGDKAE